MGFFKSKPQINTKIVTVGDAIDSLKAFNAMTQVQAGAGVDNCPDMSDPQRASWRKAVREGVINTGGEETDLDFFMSFGGGPTKDVDATEVFIKYRGEKDYNIAAQDDATGGAPGAATNFTLLKSLHAGGGKWSNVAVGGSIYHYEDGQWLRVTAVSKSSDYAHLVTVIPHSKDYQVRIKRGKKMMFNPVRFVNGYSCSSPSSSIETPGYVTSVKPFRARHDWELALDLTKKATEVMQFAIYFDDAGREVEGYELYRTTTARQEFRSMRSLIFMFGQKVDNPALASSLPFSDDKYAGFMGYLPTLQYAGGQIYDIDPTQGFGFDDDFPNIMSKQDAHKKSKEFVVHQGFQFEQASHRRNTEMFKNYTGACTFESFRRTGADKAAIEKLGISSYRYNNYSVHFRTVDAWSDTRYIGNGNMPYMAIMQPGMGLKDSKGRDVSPIEFFDAGGGSYSEIFRDHRKLDNGCEKLSGTLTEDFMMAVHGAENHILINPVWAAA